MEREVTLSSFTMKGILSELKKNAWLILLFACSVWLGVTGVGKLFYVPQYTSSSTVVLSVRGSTDSMTNLSTATQMADVIADVFSSDVMQQLVKKDTGQSIDATISCTQVQETNLLVIDAKSKDPREAYLFLNAALEHYDEVSNYVFSNAKLEILKEPSVPTEPSNHPKFSNWKLELTLLGACGMAGVILLFYFFRSTLKNSALASKQLDGAILGVIPYEKKPKEMNQKTALLISSRIVSMNYAESSRRVQAQIQRSLRAHDQKVVLVSSVEENEGKSTVAANIALALAEKHKKVCLIDGDLIKPSQYKIFERDLDPSLGLDAYLKGEKALEDVLHYQEDTGLYELFLDHSIKNPGKLLDTDVLTQLLDELKEQMDYIIIDGSPTMVSTDAEVWMEVSDASVLVVRQDWSDIRIINDTVDMIAQSGCHLTGFVLNAFYENDSLNKAYEYE